jgi:hypothetical protein
MKHLKNILTAVTLVAAASSASAIQFDLAPVSFTPGSGYTAGGVLNLNKLGVDFTADTLATQSFVLATGSSATFKFGTVTFNDGELVDGFANITGPVCVFGRCTNLTDETNDLGVTAKFSFSNPTSGLQSSTGTGFAVTGLIDPRTFLGSTLEAEGAVDFSITWADKLVDFGNGGQFKIVMDRLDFDFNGQTLDQTYHIELITAPVPEPETYALMLAGLGLVGFVARRRKQA